MFDTKFFPGAKKFWHMGKFYDWDSANLHVMSHAVHYGSSVFEGIRAYETAQGPAIFRLQEHIDRFFLSASTLNMKVPYNPEKIIDVIKEVMKINKLKAAYIRPNLFYAYGNLGLVPKVSPVELTVGCWSWGAYLGDESLERGVHALVLNRRRIHPSQMDMRAKIGGMYAQSNIAGSYARSLGFDEGIFLNMEGRIADAGGFHNAAGKIYLLFKDTQLYGAGKVCRSYFACVETLGHLNAGPVITSAALFGQLVFLFCR